MLWNKEIEKIFFDKALELTDYRKFFYKVNNEYLAYYPKQYTGRKTTLQARNAYIGDYSEKFVTEIVSKAINNTGLYAVQNVVCEELGLTKSSSADVAICTTNDVIQKPDNIKFIFEVKISIVNNWKYNNNGEVTCIGDVKTHKGNPSLLRSDSMLKAIGKSLNIRVSSKIASKIPIVVVGNTPISLNYSEKSARLSKLGFIQGFWCINTDYASENPRGYVQIKSEDDLSQNITKILSNDFQFFSSMKPHDELGRMIEVANREESYEKKAQKFLSLINE